LCDGKPYAGKIFLTKNYGKAINHLKIDEKRFWKISNILAVFLSHLLHHIIVDHHFVGAYFKKSRIGVKKCNNFGAK